MGHALVAVCARGDTGGAGRGETLRTSTGWKCVSGEGSSRRWAERPACETRVQLAISAESLHAAPSHCSSIASTPDGAVRALPQAG
jgi:hypothetical protein